MWSLRVFAIAAYALAASSASTSRLPFTKNCNQAVSGKTCLYAAQLTSQCREIEASFPLETWTGDEATSDMWSLFQANVHPACRVAPKTSEEIASVLKVVVEHSCTFAVLGGGTSPFAGVSNAQDGVTIDLQRFQWVQFTDTNSTAFVDVGGGARWADVYEFLGPLELSAAGTRNSLTGVVGSILGGEYESQ